MYFWCPILTKGGKPRFLQLADAIARDVSDGRLVAGDRLPAQRQLAAKLGIDFTTVARGYAEARERGLVEGQVGRGTFIARNAKAIRGHDPRREVDEDLTMNLPPEPTDKDLLARMNAGLEVVSANMIDLLRYQSSTGGQVDKEAASTWLSLRSMVPSLDRVAVTPGAHATILPILMRLTKPGDTILSESITYPGFLRIAARLGVNVVGVPEDLDGVLPDALEHAIKTTGAKALYLNPTLNNPTTRTIPLQRRQDIATIIARHGTRLIEDDAYGFIPQNPPAPIAVFAPDLVWHIGGLAKCIGAGLRVAFTVAPGRGDALNLAQDLKTTAVMPSPLSMALATRWIVDGTADSIRRFIREETAARQSIATEILSDFDYEASENAFNVWLKLPETYGRAEVIGQMVGSGIGLMPSDAFTVSGHPSESIRVCLGGQISRDRLRLGLELLAHIISN